MASVSSTTNDSTMNRYYTKVLSDAEKEKQAEIKRIRESSDRELQRVEDSYKNAIEKTTRDAEVAINNARTDSQEAIAQERDHSRENLDRIKEQVYNQKGQIEGDRTLEKKVLDNFVNDTFKRQELDKKNQAIREGNLIHRLDDLSNENNEKLRDFKQSQLEAFDTVHQNNKKLIDEIQNEADKKANHNIELNNERENLSRREIQQVEQASQARLDKLEKDLRNRDQYLRGINQEAISQKEKQYSDLFHKQNLEHANDFGSLEKRFESHTRNLDHMDKDENARRDQILSRQIAQSSQEKEDALKTQAKNYQQSMNDVRKSDLAEITRLQENIQKSKTTADVNLVPPAAEEVMRKTLSKNFEKAFSAERSKHDQVTGDLHQKRVNDLNEARED